MDNNNTNNCPCDKCNMRKFCACECSTFDAYTNAQTSEDRKRVLDTFLFMQNKSVPFRL